MLIKFLEKEMVDISNSFQKYGVWITYPGASVVAFTSDVIHDRGGDELIKTCCRHKG